MANRINVLTNKQHFDRGFAKGLRGSRVHRQSPGPRVAPAFLSGWRIGLRALASEYDRASMGY
jgi:hypothetical protein